MCKNVFFSDIVKSLITVKVTLCEYNLNYNASGVFTQLFIIYVNETPVTLFSRALKNLFQTSFY